MSKKIVVFGSLLQDMFIRLPPEDLQLSDDQHLSFQIGKKHYIESIHYAAGGGGANMAVSLSRLSNTVSLCATLGKDDIGKTLLAKLALEGIDISLMERSSEKTGFSVVFPSSSGNQTVFSYQGSSSYHHLKNVSLSVDVDALCIAPLHGEAMKSIEQVLKNKPQRAIVFANPSSDQLADSEKNFYYLLNYIDIVQCNYREACLFMSHFNRKRRYQAFLPQGKELDSFFEAIHDRGVKIVIVTRGKEGVTVSHQGIRYEAKIPSIVVKNTVGAGDAFGSTFLHGFLQTQSIEKSVAMALENVRVVLQSDDAQSGLMRQLR